MSERTDTQDQSLGARVLAGLPGDHPKRGAIAVGVFFAIGLVNVLLLLLSGGWWALAVLPPILFCSVLVWIVFATDFLDDRL